MEDIGNAADVAIVKTGGKSDQYMSVERLVSGNEFSGMPCLADAAWFAADVYKEEVGIIEGWSCIEDFDVPKSRWGDSLWYELRPRLRGLKLRLWTSDTEFEGRYSAVIAFKGTSKWYDWASNAHAIVRWFPVRDQYWQTRDQIRRAVGRIRTKCGDDTQIVAVGHSLGGGLAQHACYFDEAIETTIAFNSSPVTGWRALPAKCRQNLDVRDVHIFRIHQDDEALDGFRRIMTALYGFTPRRTRAEKFTYIQLHFPCEDGGQVTSFEAISRHGMERIAQGLRLAKTQGS